MYEGSDATIVAIVGMVIEALAAARELEADKDPSPQDDISLFGRKLFSLCG